MKTLDFDFQQAIDLFAKQAQEFLECSQKLSDAELLDPSLCRGWSRLDVVVHVRMGLEEMASSANIGTLSPPDHDAASYWIGLKQGDDDDPVERTLWLRRTAASYTRPKKAVEHLKSVINRSVSVVRSMQPGVVCFQSQKLSSGNFLGTWVVELAVHQLDLTPHNHPVGIDWSKKTIETLAGVPLPIQLNDDDSILAAIGRKPWPRNVNKPDAYPINF